MIKFIEVLREDGSFAVINTSLIREAAPAGGDSEELTCIWYTENDLCVIKENYNTFNKRLQSFLRSKMVEFLYIEKVAPMHSKKFQQRRKK